MSPRIRLTEKTLIIANSLVIIVSVALTTLFTVQTERVIRKQFEERTRALAKNLAYNAEYGLVAGDDAALDALVKGVMDQPDVVFCVIRDEASAEVAGRFAPREARSAAFLEWTRARRAGDRAAPLQSYREGAREYISIAAPVFAVAAPASGETLVVGDDLSAAKKTRLAGSVEVGVSLEGARSLIRENATLALGAVALLVIVMSAVSIIWVKRLLRPVGELLRAMRAFAAGDLDYRIALKSRDEIGDLAVSFNVMADDLKRTTVSVERLTRSEKRFEDVAGNVGDWIWEIDGEAKIVYTSRACESVTGHPPAEATGRFLYDFIEPSSRAYGRETMLALMARREKMANAAFSFLHKDGRRIDVECAGEPVFDGDAFLGYRGMCRDITARRRAEESLLETVRLRSNFTATVSHELRTPLTAIKESISIVLEGEAGALNDEQKDFLATAKRNVDRLNRLINDVLDFTKMKSAKMRLKVRPEDINRLIAEAVAAHQVLAVTRRLYVRVEPEPAAPRVVCDADKIIQVITNLVSNALKFTEKGGITVSVAKQAEGVVVTVADTGPGIPPEDLPKFFTEFHQLQHTKQVVPGGTGLGLAISKEIVELHGGSIWAESEAGQGAAFRFFLPYEKRYKVLIVDSEENVRFLTAELLRRNGYVVYEAATGLDGIRELYANRPDVAIVDLKLPDVNGYEVIGRIYSDKEISHTSVIVAVGRPGEADTLDPTIPRLVKPFRGEELLAMIKGMIAKERTE